MTHKIPLSSIYYNQTLIDAVKSNNIELVQYVEQYRNHEFYDLEWIRKAMQYGRHELVFYFLESLKTKPVPSYFQLYSLNSLFEAAIQPFKERPSYIDQAPLFQAIFDTTKDVVDLYLCLYQNRRGTAHDGNYYSRSFFPLLKKILACKEYQIFDIMVNHIEWDYSKEELYLFAFGNALASSDYNLLHHVWNKGYAFEMKEMNRTSPIMDDIAYYGFSEEIEDYVNKHTQQRILRENLNKMLSIQDNLNQPKI